MSEPRELKKTPQGANVVNDRPKRRMRVNISEVVRSSEFQVRRKLDEGTIGRYAAAYKAGTDLPPITVAKVGGVPYVVDGWHRLAALERNGAYEVDIEVLEATPEEARWLAAKANLTHGLPLKGKELRQVFRAYVKAGKYRKPNGRRKSYREIGRELGRTHPTIKIWMQQDFPKIARLYRNEEQERMTGGIAVDDPMKIVLENVTKRLDEIVTLSKGNLDADTREELIKQIERALEEAKKGGPWEPVDWSQVPDDF